MDLKVELRRNDRDIGKRPERERERERRSFFLFFVSSARARLVSRLHAGRQERIEEEEEEKEAEGGDWRLEGALHVFHPTPRRIKRGVKEAWERGQTVRRPEKKVGRPMASKGPPTSVITSPV